MNARPAAALVLRPEYQVPAIDALREALRKYRRVLLQLPTGGGKTAIASFLAQEIAARGKLVYFNCHRAELVEQTSRTWQKYGIAHGFIAAGRPKALAHAVICSIDTLKNRLLTTPEPAVAIWDECHHLGAAGWQAIMDAWPNARHIGLSATPWRLDGSGLGRQFEYMVEGPTPAWLIERGFLSRYEIFAPNPPDMTGARKDKSRDWTKRDASQRMDMPKRTGDIVKHWRKYANGLRTIAFAVNVADSMTIVARFNESGIPAAHLDADTPKEDRKQIIRDFADGRLLVVSNVALFGEGFDLSAIAQTDVTVDCLIDAAPTQSLSAVLQRWGRVLRPKDFPAVILDHAGNSNVHGFPDDEREWSLDDRERTGKGGRGEDGPPPPYTCKCFRQIKRPLPTKCPHCGIAIVPDVKPVDEGDEELTRRTDADKAAVRAQLRREEHDAKSIADLIALANRRGYSNPTGWAFKKWSNSPWRKQIARDSTQLQSA
jgi:DNA repair protein RadD